MVLAAEALPVLEKQLIDPRGHGDIRVSPWSALSPASRGIALEPHKSRIQGVFFRLLSQLGSGEGVEATVKPAEKPGPRQPPATPCMLSVPESAPAASSMALGGVPAL